MGIIRHKGGGIGEHLGADVDERDCIYMTAWFESRIQSRHFLIRVNKWN